MIGPRNDSAQFMECDLSIRPVDDHNDAMPGISDYCSKRAQSVSAVEPEDDSANEAIARVPIRRMLGCTGISVVLHLAAFLLLSLIMIVQKEMLPEFMSEVRFEDLSAGEAVLAETPGLELPEIEARLLDVREFPSTTAPNVGMTSSEFNVDLTAFAAGSDSPAGQGLPTAIAGIASGIQDRVAKAGGRKGEVQFSLAWHSFNDLDLHVIAPSGEHISYSHRTSNCKGTLDVDMNAATTNGGRGEDFSDEPVENIRWLDRNAPSGRFTVIVNQFRWRNGQSQDRFQLLAVLGEKTEVVEQLMTAQQPVSIHRFQYVRSTLSARRREQLSNELSATQAREEVEATAILDRGMVMQPGRDRDRVMNSVISRFPHTDASIRAMQELAPPAKN